MGVAADRKAVVVTVRAVIAQVERAARRWKFGPERMSIPMAAAGFLRAAELLGEALDIGTKPKSAGANVLVRTSFEYWLIGVWACFGGNDAMLGIEKSRSLKERTMAQENKLPQHALDKLQRDLDEVKPSRQGVAVLIARVPVTSARCQEPSPCVEVASSRPPDAGAVVTRRCPLRPGLPALDAVPGAEMDSGGARPSLPCGVACQPGAARRALGWRPSDRR